MKILSSLCSALSVQTIVNCFKKADSTNKLVQRDADNPLKEIEDELNQLKEVEPTAVPEDLSAENFIRLDNEVITTASVPTDEEILSSIVAGDDNEDDNDLQPGDGFRRWRSETPFVGRAGRCTRLHSKCVSLQCPIW